MKWYRHLLLKEKKVVRNPDNKEFLSQSFDTGHLVVDKTFIPKEVCVGVGK